jgi:hypothetical protein
MTGALECFNKNHSCGQASEWFLLYWKLIMISANVAKAIISIKA